MLPILLLVCGDLSVLPSAVSLDGTHAGQRLLVVEALRGEATADLTANATFASSNPAVARIDAAGNVTALSDGEATVTAKVGERTASAVVKVTGTKREHTWSFRNHVIPVLTRTGCNSGACHGALAGKGGLKLSLRGYDPAADHFALTRQALGRRVDREAPEKSLLLLKPTMASAHGGGLRVEAGSREYRVLSEWIAAGAPAMKADDVRVQRLEVLPGVSVLKPGDAAQIVVRAWYSDGHAEDVTRWAKFTSSEETVANVDADGRVRVLAPGEAAVSVLYSNLVASATVVVPYPNRLDPKLLAASPRNNFIDEHVLAKLARLNLPPSPGCADEEFLRRAYLDTAGILPTPAERDAFLADRDPKKREKVIDALLERPEFVDYWAYKWSDLLLITTRRLPQPAVWSFYQFVRQSVADNKPWDRFARDVITASGSTLDNGAANYFVLHKDVPDLTESTAVTFMGMSITCARCHNHPLERWTQDQYWQLANLFSRVGLKNGDRAGSVHVQPQPNGEAYHPRSGVPMPPTPLDGKPVSLESASDRRKVFADWLTKADNPYFARALVNRVWRNFMGRALVEAEDDLRETNPATNEPLLDALSKDFVRTGYDLKKLVRTITRSAAYQRSSRPTAGNETDDRFYSRYLVRRLSAEVILDAYSQVTGVPTPFTHLDSNAKDSTAAYAGFPRGLRAMQLPDSLVTSRFLDAFGRPDRSQTCSCERSADASVGQALHLNNGQTLNDKLRDKTSLVTKLLAEKATPEESARRLYEAALGRRPTAAEVAKLTPLLSEAADRREGMEDLFWAVLTSREFLFNR
ncbi:MAG: DUF1549 domain-containing protein [Gemmataceae bacterium]